ncbi:replication/maintenance protein RepL, partial [Pseudomonas helleri]|uniref:replication/maintenance protein RepL n=1 Tax=Pseudomonas helleri TaxID=1608996 RepID=UPI001E2BEAFE
MKQMRELARRNPVAMQILFYLVEHMGKSTNAVVCSYKTLSEVTDLSRTSVAKAIKYLKDDNWLDAIKIGNATAYCVNERAFWQSARNARRYGARQRLPRKSPDKTHSCACDFKQRSGFGRGRRAFATRSNGLGFGLEGK